MPIFHVVNGGPIGAANEGGRILGDDQGARGLVLGRWGGDRSREALHFTNGSPHRLVSSHDSSVNIRIMKFHFVCIAETFSEPSHSHFRHSFFFGYRSPGYSDDLPPPCPCPLICLPSSSTLHHIHAWPVLESISPHLLLLQQGGTLLGSGTRGAAAVKLCHRLGTDATMGNHQSQHQQQHRW